MSSPAGTAAGRRPRRHLGAVHDALVEGLRRSRAVAVVEIGRVDPDVARLLVVVLDVHPGAVGPLVVDGEDLAGGVEDYAPAAGPVAVSCLGHQGQVRLRVRRGQSRRKTVTRTRSMSTAETT